MLQVIDCIDHQHAIAEFFDDGTTVMRYEKYSFIKERVADKHLFKIIEEPRSTYFVSDDFRNRVLDNSLTGFHFEEVWGVS